VASAASVRRPGEPGARGPGVRAGGGPDEAHGLRSGRAAALGERASASLIRRTLPPVETAVGTYRRIIRR